MLSVESLPETLQLWQIGKSLNVTGVSTIGFLLLLRSRLLGGLPAAFQAVVMVCGVCMFSCGSSLFIVIMLVFSQAPPCPPNRYSDELPLLCCFSQAEASIVENNFSCRLHHQRSYRVVLPLQVKRTYSQGTYRAGAMRQVSLVGAVDEEVGDYFPEFIRMLEESPFLEVSGCVFVFVYI